MSAFPGLVEHKGKNAHRSTLGLGVDICSHFFQINNLGMGLLGCVLSMFVRNHHSFAKWLNHLYFHHLHVGFQVPHIITST